MKHHTPGVIAGSVLCLVVAGGCASTGGGGPSRDWDLLTFEEVQASNQIDAYDLIRTERPNWLRQRGRASLLGNPTLVVYLDGMQLGGPMSLRQIQINMISSVQYLDAASATQRFGTGHAMGAIVVSSR